MACAIRTSRAAPQHPRHFPTRTSQDVESYDRASELEQLGGQILELAPSQWRTIAEAKGA